MLGWGSGRIVGQRESRSVEESGAVRGGMQLEKGEAVGHVMILFHFPN